MTTGSNVNYSTSDRSGRKGNSMSGYLIPDILQKPLRRDFPSYPFGFCQLINPVGNRMELCALKVASFGIRDLFRRVASLPSVYQDVFEGNDFLLSAGLHDP